MDTDPVVTRDYVYDQGYADERKRIAGMEALWDPGSRALFEELGISKGWKCLEVGAGGGSLVEWMAGQGASVLAVDIDTRFVESLASDSIEVRRLDIREDELPQAEFDLVHARLVLEHLNDRTQILRRLADTLRPGGWIVIEDYDWSNFTFAEDDPSLAAMANAILTFMQQAGFERDYGRRVVDEIAEAGFTDVRGEGRLRVIDSSAPGFDFFRLSFESLRETLVDTGMISAADADAASARWGEDMRMFTPVMMAGIGRRG